MDRESQRGVVVPLSSTYCSPTWAHLYPPVRWDERGRHREGGRDFIVFYIEIGHSLFLTRLGLLDRLVYVYIYMPVHVQFGKGVTYNILIKHCTIALKGGSTTKVERINSVFRDEYMFFFILIASPSLIECVPYPLSRPSSPWQHSDKQTQSGVTAWFWPYLPIT